MCIYAAYNSLVLLSLALGAIEALHKAEILRKAGSKG
jgi:hypothetical protein